MIDSGIAVVVGKIWSYIVRVLLCLTKALCLVQILLM